MKHQLNYWTTVELKEDEEIVNNLCIFCNLKASVDCHAIDKNCTCTNHKITKKV
jgi:hypothetical protein